MKAITVTYLSATNHKGRRWVASDGDNKITISADHEATAQDAAVKLCRKLNYFGTLVSGTITKRGALQHEVFVFLEHDTTRSKYINTVDVKPPTTLDLQQYNSGYADGLLDCYRNPSDSLSYWQGFKDGLTQRNLNLEAVYDDKFNEGSAAQ